MSFDVSSMDINDTVTLADVPVPDGIELLDDVDETVIATLTPPRLETEDDEIESETDLVGEDAAAAAPEDADGDSGSE